MKKTNNWTHDNNLPTTDWRNGDTSAEMKILSGDINLLITTHYIYYALDDPFWVSNQPADDPIAE